MTKRAGNTIDLVYMEFKLYPSEESGSENKTTLLNRTLSEN